MRYKSKMILLYACFIVILALVIGLTYYNYNIDRFLEREEQSLSFYAKEISQQFDGSVRMMEFAINSLVYDIDVVNALLQWSNAGKDPLYPALYADQAASTLHSRLYRDTLNSFYRVIVFNRYGDVVANRTNAKRAINPAVTWKDIPWLDQATGTRGHNLLIGPHIDDWGVGDRPLVYSYVKEVQGRDMGYIEVQHELSTLRDLLELPGADVGVLLLHPDGQLMYSTVTMDEGDLRRLTEDAQTIGSAASPRQITAAHRSEYTGALVLTVMSGRGISDATGYIAVATVLICLAFVVVSLLFVYLISSYLTRPIEQVHAMIEHTRIETIGEPVERVKSIDEIETLVDAYQDLMGRLSVSIKKERQIARLHLKTQFDALQAQVNPHFLFNVLNVISQRGMMLGDEMICEICSSLAAILRYSTNTRNRLSTIGEELEYLAQYAFLLKSRYRHLFECTAGAQDAVKGIEIPRLTIQQLVENSVSHGFNQSSGPMKIEVDAYRDEGACAIRVRDNGAGFPEGKIASLYEQFDKIRRDFSQDKAGPELEIGGMGLNNIYARLYLTFQDRLTLSLSNDGGATVVIRIEDA